MSQTAWSQGYVTDTHYTDSFFRELSPAWLNYVAALNGIAPRALDRPFSYLELGCGFGSSTIANAGAFPQGEFHACDFNPAHIEGGKRHADAIGISNLLFHEASFDRLLSLDLPPFDFIALHGVYSWVDAEARQSIRRAIHKTLKPGGFVYLSYNCLPGWSVEAPLRKMLLELATVAEGESSQRTEEALRVLQQLSRGQLRYFTANPSAVTAVDAYARRPSSYLAHEFLNETWEPFYSIDVADEVAEADASYVGSATLVDNHPTLFLGAQAAETVARLPTLRQRQLAIDFAANQRFRRDVFVRNGTKLEPSEAIRGFHAAAIGSLTHPERIKATVTVPRGEIRFQSEFIDELSALMQRGSMTIGDVVDRLDGPGRDSPEIVRNLTFLVAAGTLVPFARAHATKQPAVLTRRLVNGVVERALTAAIDQRERRVVPCESLGNGVPTQPFEALAITEWLAGADRVEALAPRLLAGIKRLGSHISIDGQDLQPGEDEVEYSRLAAKSAIEHLVPNFARLGLIV